jgi:hypothetical protein
VVEQRVACGIAVSRSRGDVSAHGDLHGLMARMHRRHAGTNHLSHAGTSHAGMGCCGFGFGASSAHAQDSRHDLAALHAGSTAFEEYRLDTLRRLEHEEKEFHSFLDRLRAAKDKSEFDQFMAERRGGDGRSLRHRRLEA